MDNSRGWLSWLHSLLPRDSSGKTVPQQETERIPHSVRYLLAYKNALAGRKFSPGIAEGAYATVAAALAGNEYAQYVPKDITNNSDRFMAWTRLLSEFTNALEVGMNLMLALGEMEIARMEVLGADLSGEKLADWQMQIALSKTTQWWAQEAKTESRVAAQSLADARSRYEGTRTQGPKVLEVPRGIESAPAGAPQHKANQWLINAATDDGLFDTLHSPSTDWLNSHKEEWLRLRATQSLYKPAHVLKSMRTVIQEERKRRKTG